MRTVRVILLGIFSALGGLFFAPVTLASGWEGELEYQSQRVYYGQNFACPGYLQSLFVAKMPERQEVCLVEGANFRFGTYFAGGTAPNAGVMFRFDTTLQRLYGVCEEFWGCHYSAEGDRLVELRRLGLGHRQAVVYDRVSERIKQVFDSANLELRYEFDRSRPEYILADELARPLSTGAVALSGNGHWLVAELRGLGIALVNLETKQARRVIAPGVPYGRGFDPLEELAVTDNGGLVVVAGENAGLDVTRIAEGCGERLQAYIPEGFSPGVVACPRVSIGRHQLSPSFRVALKPHFNTSGTSLRLVVLSYDRGPLAVTIRSDGQFGSELAYLALGDSFTSGEGEIDDSFYLPGTNEASEKCHTSLRSYPFLVASGLLLAPKDVRNIACAGARMHDIISRETPYLGQGKRLAHLDPASLKYQQAQALGAFLPGRRPQADFIEHAQPSVVTLGVGGNDAGLMDKLRSCAMPDTCEWVIPERRQAMGRELQYLYERLVSFYLELQSLSPQSRIYTVGYPQAVAESHFCTPLVAALLNTEERQFLRESIKHLNKVIAAAALKAGLSFIDSEDSFRGHELCSGSIQSAMNGFRTGDDISLLSSLPMLKVIGGETFHPTPYGHQLIATKILREHADILVRQPCTQSACRGSSLPPALSDYWRGESITTSNALPQATELLPTGTLAPGGTTLVELPAGSVAPNSTVRLELHSQTVMLGEFTARVDGSLEASFPLGYEVAEGIHTLHLLGMSYSGEAIDLYQTIAIEKEDGSLVQEEFVIGENITDGDLSNDHSVISSEVVKMNRGEILGTATHRSSLSSKSAVWGGLMITALFGGLLVGLVLWLLIRRRNSTQDEGG